MDRGLPTQRVRGGQTGPRSGALPSIFRGLACLDSILFVFPTRARAVTTNASPHAVLTRSPISNAEPLAPSSEAGSVCRRGSWGWRIDSGDRCSSGGGLHPSLLFTTVCRELLCC